MKQLIVNADDLGADEPRNNGIFEVIKAGAVTSVSILPNGPALKDAVDRIRTMDPDSISIGIHINLSEGKPLTSGLKRLTGADGCFLGKKTSQQLLVRRGDSNLEDEIRKELIAQISAILDTGIPIDHLDGHQHVHIFPAVVRPAMEEAKAYGISWIRIPEEYEYQISSITPELAEEALFFSNHAEAARPFSDASGILCTDHFRGLYLKGRLQASNWLECMESLPHGITELMVHPGHAAENNGPFSGFSTPDREKELAALTDIRFHQALMNNGVQLIKFPKAAI
jgi:chitin disaccharide deacetylase